MTFLQPLVLWGLPLLLLPVLIHLLNRMRYRSQPWGAMQLLLAANRSSISQAKLRQFLILLFRVLAVAMLILFLSRPLAGGWMGWVFSGAPDVVMVLLDRSASMGTMLPNVNTTKREQALKLISQAGKSFEGASRFVLIESAQSTPQELGSLNSLSELSLTASTDTAADIPRMLQTALNWLLENKAGAAEIWIASDLQRSNWLPDDPRLKTVLAQLGALPQKVRVRLLALNESGGNDASVALENIIREKRGASDALQLALNLQRSGQQTETLPLTLTLDETPSQTDVKMDGERMLSRQRIPLESGKSAGWGSVRLPADGNLQNNETFFVYGAASPLQAVVVANDSESARVLSVGTSVIGGDTNALGGRDAFHRVPEFQNRDGVEAVPPGLDKTSLVIWQGALPSGAAAEKMRQYVNEGGVALFLPPGNPSSERFNGIGWGEVQSAEANQFFKIARWDELDGPLARTDEGTTLPVADLEISRRQLITGQKTVVAGFSDAEPFLARQTLGRGEIYFCATLPSDAWSSLADGPVLIPMLQRMMQTGAKHLQHENAITVGEMTAADRNRSWISIDAPNKNPQLHAGIFRSGERLLAVNRPAAEDEPDILSADDARQLFVGMPTQLWQERGNDTNQVLQREVWRLFVIVMLAFLIAEGILILPQKLQEPTSNIRRNAKTQTSKTAVAAVWVMIFSLTASALNASSSEREFAPSQFTGSQSRLTSAATMELST